MAQRLDFYQKLNAKHWQEQAAMHSEWALDDLLEGDPASAVKHQEASAIFSKLARGEMQHDD